MCGIVGFIGEQEAAPILLEGLARMEYRGYDSAGLAVLDAGKGLQVVKAKGRLKVLNEKVDGGKKMFGTVGVGHTRWATHGEPSDANSHPLLSDSGRIAVVHNGIIENYMEIKEFLQEKGVVFHSDTDTEVVAQLLDYYYRGDILDAVQKVLHRIEGSYGLGIICSEHPEQLIAARKDSPLVLGYGDGFNMMASDVTALIKYTRDVSYMENGEIAVLTRQGIQVYNILLEPVEKEHSTVDWDISDAEKGGYEHFMFKEIMEQPEAIRKTITPRIKDDRVVLDDIDLSADYVKNISKFYIIACGSSYHVGMVGKYVLEKMLRKPVEVALASEFRYCSPIVDKNTLVIVISQSGETLDTMEALREAKRLGGRTLAIVNVVGSSIARAADYILYTYAGPEIAVASTKAYVVQMCVLYLFALRLAYARGKLEEAETKRLTAELLRAGEVIKPRLDDCEQIKYLASRFVNTQSCFFIGRGFDYALSLEGSLKLKEISYVHSDAYAAGELKHGTISLITDGVPVIALATQKQVYEKTISNAKETKSRGARVILFTTKDAVVPEGVADYIVRLDEYEDLLMPLQLIVPLQLFAYYMAVLRGCDVDKPRNLAKSVTVE